MDMFKKILGIETESEERKKPNQKNEFKKPVWFEEDTDDELFENNKAFGFDMFQDSNEMQKQFETQIFELIKSFEEIEGTSIFDKSMFDDYSNAFENEKMFPQRRGSSDTDLDGEIYADQLRTLLQRISPEIKAVLPNEQSIKLSNIEKKNKTDDEKIMDRIHGLFKEDIPSSKTDRRLIMKGPLAPGSGSTFAGTFQGPRTFGQSIMQQTIRKPDGSIESRRTVRDSDGNCKTTITRTKNGETETVVTENTKADPVITEKTYTPADFSSKIQLNDYMYLNENGYTLPKNMW